MECDGLVVELIPIKEEDAMVRLLTNDGLISFFARRAMNQKSPDYSALQPFSSGHYWISEGTQSGLRLKQARLDKYHGFHYATLPQLAVLELIKETLSHVTIDGEAELVYGLVNQTIEAASSPENAFLAAARYLARLLDGLGWGLQLSQCVVCNAKTDIVGVSLPLGGFVCRKHYHPEEAMTLPAASMKLLHDLSTNAEIKLAPDGQVKPLIGLLAQHYLNATGRPLNSVHLF
ncbi:MAG: DNA repair protein RecO [Bacilli bacterium]|jgi:DNA repair protein RecO (recombination protein O)